MSYWVDVRDKLPEGKCIATYLNELGNKRTIIASYFKRYTVESNGDDECACEYNEADDIFYVEEGWYECIDNWDDFTSVKVYQGDITHWMPLPEAPK